MDFGTINGGGDSTGEEGIGGVGEGVGFRSCSTCRFQITNLVGESN